MGFNPEGGSLVLIGLSKINIVTFWCNFCSIEVNHDAMIHMGSCNLYQKEVYLCHGYNKAGQPIHDSMNLVSIFKEST